MVSQTIREHAAPLSNAVQPNRSRRLIKCAKETRRYPGVDRAESANPMSLCWWPAPSIRRREILGICEGAKEDKSGWSAFLRHLVDRGLNGVQLIISDACRGLMESAAEYLPDAQWQRCMVHFYRNVFSHVPATRVREVSHMLKAIHAQENRDAADRKARTIVEDLRAAKMHTAADLVERSVSETLTYYAFPDIHWQKIRTNNPLERIMKEIRRRTRVVGAFPDGQSCLNLAAARLRYIAGTAWSAKCYMNMRPLYQPQVPQTEAVA